MSNRRPMVTPITTPLFTANQGVENDEFNRRNRPANAQQDQFEKRVYDPIDALTKRYGRSELPETCQYLTRPKLKRRTKSKPPKPYKSPIATETLEEPSTLGRIVSTMPELPSQRHVNCFDGDYEPTAGENIDALWIDRTVAFGSMTANTQQKLLEEKQEESLRRFRPRKWNMDIESKISDEILKKKVESRMKDFGAGFQLPFVPCERRSRIPMKSSSEIWRQKPLPPRRWKLERKLRGESDDEGETVEKFKLLMSKLHKEELWAQNMMESTPSLPGEGNRIKGKCSRQEYLTRRLAGDILSRWSQLHGFAIPHLQTLPEHLRRRKAMMDAACTRPTAAPTSDEVRESVGDDTTGVAATPATLVSDAAIESREQTPPPPENTPLPTNDAINEDQTWLEDDAPSAGEAAVTTTAEGEKAIPSSSLPQEETRLPEGTDDEAEQDAPEIGDRTPRGEHDAKEDASEEKIQPAAATEVEEEEVLVEKGESRASETEETQQQLPLSIKSAENEEEPTGGDATEDRQSEEEENEEEGDERKRGIKEEEE